ncbi:hypothetical protein ABZP36_006061 [Zizania latifolia]
MRSLAVKSSWLSALSATKNRMYNRIAQIAGHAWVNISVQNATFMMMMYQRTTFTVMDAASVELVVQRISFTVTNADAAIAMRRRIIIIVWKEQCITIALYASSICLTRRRTSVHCIVDTRFIWSAYTR